MLLSVSVSARSGTDELLEPIDSRNLSPLYANFGVPTMAGNETLAPGQFKADWSLHWASHSVRESNGQVSLELDGETRRQDFRVALGLSDRFSASLNIPYVEHSPGQLDSWIDGWHAFWGLPDGARDEQPSDALAFVYTGGPGFALERDSGSLGDVELGLEGVIYASPAWSLTGVVQYKLSTGDARGFAGSDDEALALGLRLHVNRCGWDRLRCHLQAGFVDVGNVRDDPAADQRVPFGGVSLAWQLFESISVLAQLDLHDTVYRTDPLDRNGAPVWGTLGLRWQPSQAWLLDAQFSEDLSVGAAPDITFRFSLGRRF